MKSKVIIAAAAFFTLAACNQKTSTERVSNAVSAGRNSEVAINQPNGVSIDSVSVGDSIEITKVLTADFRKKLLVFNGLDGVVLDSIYNGGMAPDHPKVTDFTKAGIAAYLKNEQKSFYDQVREEQKQYSPQFSQTWNQRSEMKVFSKENQYLTLNITGDGFMGGAHGYAFNNYKVIDIKNQKKLMLEDIMDVSKIEWAPLLLKNFAADRKGELFGNNELSYTQNFHFTKDKITFTYGQYEIAPYSSGIINIDVPFADIASALKPEFKQRMRIK